MRCTRISGPVLLFAAVATAAVAVPVFKTSDFRKADAPVYIGYSAGISGTVSNTVPGDSLILSKVSGPDWLAVSPEGALSGIPERTDLGTNIFTVQVSDGQGGTDQTTMTVRVIEHPRYPRFSWDTVPVYIHFGKTPASLTDAEVAFIAGVSDFICLEKGHARTQFGSTEAGISHDAVRLKTANPAMKILYYWNSFLNYPLYNACTNVAQNPVWVFRDTNGVPVYKTDTLEQYNILNTAFRQWWAAEAGKGVAQYGCDGLFADAVMQPLRSIWMPYWAPATSNDLIFATCDQLDRARLAMGTNSLVIYNGIRSLSGDATEGLDYLAHADGVTVEHFTAFACTNKESIARDIEMIHSIGASGKVVIVKGWPDPDFTWLNTNKMAMPYSDLVIEARNKIAFSLACYLVAAQPYSYFCYSWGYREIHGSLADFPEYRMPLGRPLGDAVRAGWVYTRSFEHLNVTVDIEKRTASVSGAGAQYFREWIGGTNAVVADDPDGDGVNNLIEYALGGDPALYGAVSLPAFENKAYGSVQGLEYVYQRRRDAVARRVTYRVESCTNLVSPVWITNGISEAGSGILDGNFERVTNHVQSGATGFVRLKIGIAE